MHEPPGAQATHAPALQTMFAPHLVPSGALPASVQTGAPVVHAIVAVLHGLGGGHEVPAGHAMHAPDALQTLSPWHF